VLRIGSARVGHRLEIGGEEHALSAIAPGERVIIRLRQDR